jgi:hypothetical protein
MAHAFDRQGGIGQDQWTMPVTAVTGVVGAELGYSVVTV